MLPWTITRRQVSRDLWLLRPSPVIAHCFRTKTFKTGNEPSQQRRTKWSWNAPQSMDVWPQGGHANYKLALTKSTANNWTAMAFATCLYRDWTPCCYSCWPSPTPGGVQGGVRPSVLRKSGGIGLWVSEWVQSLSRVQLFATPWTVAYQASPSMGFSRQEYWSGLPFPSPGDLPDPGIEPRSPPFQADALTSEPPGKPDYNIKICEHFKYCRVPFYGKTTYI